MINELLQMSFLNLRNQLLNQSSATSKSSVDCSGIYSQASMNSSRFEEVKNARKQKQSQILSKIANVQQRMEKTRQNAKQCLKFRPVLKNSKEN